MKSTEIKFTAIPSTEEVKAERDRLAYRSRYGRVLRSTIYALVVVAAVAVLLATLFLPQGVLNVPQYLLYNKFGWLDSPFYLAIWVHCAFATETYFVYQLIQFMRNVPRDLDEAAAIDGCSSFQTLYKVIVPMLGPALVSCALFQFMWSCNDFMGPLLYVSTPGKYPMSLFVKLSMDGDTGFAWNKILALSLLSILPQLIVFFCAQDQFVEGISAGAVKG